MRLDFLDPANQYYPFYQLRLRWLVLDQYYRQRAAMQQPTSSLMPPGGARAPPPLPPPPPGRVPPPPPPRLAPPPPEVDNSAMVTRGGGDNSPLISTMRFDASTSLRYSDENVISPYLCRIAHNSCLFGIYDNYAIGNQFSCQQELIWVMRRLDSLFFSHPVL